MFVGEDLYGPAIFNVNSLDLRSARRHCQRFQPKKESTLREDYIEQALRVVPDANILINVVSRRVKQLRYHGRPLVESLEKLDPEDIALREIIEGKIHYQLGEE